MAETTPEPVAWIWAGRIALGTLTLIIGDPGVGKSLLLMECAARISTGTAWPDGAPALRGDVIILSAEDGPADTLRPRLDAAGADPQRVHLLQAVRDASGERLFTLQRDLPALERAIEQTRALVVLIDPLSAYLGACDSFKEAEVRALFAPLAAIADGHRVAMVGVMHLTKAGQRRAVHRAQGSVAFTAAARSVLALALDPGDRARRVLVGVKSNLATPAAALAFRIVADSATGAPRLVWEPGPVEGVDPDRLLGPEPPLEEDDERREAEAYLVDVLRDGEVPAASIIRGARGLGLSERTLYRAKRRLGVASRKAGQPGSRGAWYWSLPKAATLAHVAVFGEAHEKKSETAPGSPKAATSQSLAVFGGDLAALGGGQRDREGPRTSPGGHPAGAAQGAPPAAAPPAVQKLQAVLLEVGARRGWPRLSIAPGRAVAAGEAGWRTFAARAGREDLVLGLEAALRGDGERSPEEPDCPPRGPARSERSEGTWSC